MQISRALTPARIARSLVTVMALSFISTVLPPVIAPFLSTSKAEAVTATFTAAGSSIVIPAGVTSVQIEAMGAAGGKGGDDGNTGTSGTVAGRVITTIAVTPGDVLGLYGGNKGTAGTNSAIGTGGGAGGADTLPTSLYWIAGTGNVSPDFAGGSGGAAGSQGSSGGGGGAGAASIATINNEIVVIAAGAGGGGGAGNGVNVARAWNGTLAYNGTSFTGGNGQGLAAANSCPGASNNNGDGGGGGGGGGGYYAGAGGLAPLYTGECSGYQGSPGGNYVATRATTTTNDRTSQTADGYVKYTYNFDAVTTCAKTTSTFDIYTIESITTTANCTWTVPASVSVVDFFLVGGGGGGGGDGGGGGGGGAALSRTAIAVTPSSTITLKAGYGGAGSAWGVPFAGVSGDSTTVQLASGTLFSALGGSAASPGLNATSGPGGTASNGGFAGGAGGSASTTAGTVGSAGKSGISNYYTGTKIEYGGGGGGGVFANNAITTPAAGASGGGAGAYAVSTSFNAVGSKGTDGLGGGGGGGAAVNAGTGLRVEAGKGGSGVILIRYATDSFYSFPSSLTSALAGRYLPSDLQLLDSARKGWIDSSGTNATVVDANITATGMSIATANSLVDASTAGSTRNMVTLKGTPSSKATLTNLNTGYTLFHVARFVSGSTANYRIMTGTGSNWLSGFHWGVAEAHHNSWMTGNASVVNSKWLLSTDQAKLYRANGVDVSFDNESLGSQVSSVTNFGLNLYASQESDFVMSDILIFNRELNNGEIRLMETYLSRVNGLTLSPYFNTSETDTAFNPSGMDLFQQLDTRNDLNDTFTVEVWVKPDATCATNSCTIYARENSIRIEILSGNYNFILWGDGAWQWVNTNIPVKTGEWHHITLAKTLAGNNNDSAKFYVDGQLVFTKLGSPYRTATTAVASPSNSSTLAASGYRGNIGCIFNGTERFYGLIDEFKTWKVARTLSEIQSDMHSNDPSSPLMTAYYDFNNIYGARTQNFRFPNIAYGGSPRSDLFSTAAQASLVYTDVKTVSTSGPYTTIAFPRSYITQFGGWKVPDSVTAATTIVVGGGGGAGKSDSNLSAPGGAGGGGGVTVVGRQSYTAGDYLQVKVGAGGQGALTKADDASTRNGGSSYFGIAGGLTALGGGGGGSNNYQGAGGSTIATGGGGGGNPAAGNCATQGPSGGTVTSGYNGATGGWGWGGAGGSARGAATTSGCYGIEGSGFVDSVTALEYGRTGSNQGYSTWSVNSKYTTPNIGWGGSVSYGSGAAISSGAGMPGSAGVVIVRYLNITKPTYTQPSNTYLNVGMTETFTTNVAQDSATVMLTRTFRWESTTAGSGGTYSPIQIGTGAANAAFAWIPSDTSTSGNQYLYRVVVNDSDTYGLYVVDTSTSVFATINGTLKLNGVNTLKKTINIAKNETYTVLAGTSTYRYTLTPTIAGITLDTNTVMSPVIKISDTATVGTYYETLTVIDSVTASAVIPLTIVVTAPPTLTNSAEVITNGQVFAIDASNSASYNPATGAWSDISGNKKVISVNAAAGTSPTYSSDYSGTVSLSNTNYQALYTTGIGKLTYFTIDAWVRLDASISAQSCIMTSEYTGASINYYFCFDTSRTIFGGFYTGGQFTYMRTTSVVPLNTWNHLVVTWNGIHAKVYINGIAAAGTEIYENAGVNAPTPDGSKTYIGKWWDTSFQTASTSYTPMTIGSLRLYNLALSDTQVALNYAATSNRFTSINQTQISPSQKYGTLNLETYTVTSGGDTKTVTFAIGNRAGIKWDTSTAGSIKLSVQESLTPGIYYDTVTVTDNLGASTYLPIKFNISKADTITVTAGAATSMTYNKSAATSLPGFTITGLVSSDTGTVTRKYTGVDWTKSCALGGGCEVGDTGPGGGTIFYISPTVIDSATGISSGGTYLEVAPLGWWGSAGETTTAWAKVQTSVTGTSAAIGSGAENTRLITTALTTNAVAAKTAADLVLNGKSDWFLPSTQEVKEMYEALYAPVLAGNLTQRNYWSSTQGSNTAQADTYWFGSGGLVSPTDKLNSFTLRPIRAYSPDTITSTTVPINADSYTVTVDSPTMTIGNLSNYQGVILQSSGLNIAKARQDILSVASYVTTFGSNYTITILGGSGSGAFTESFTAGSTASGCSITAHVITTTSQGVCMLQIKKGYSRNYLAESVTAGVYFLIFVNNQPSPTVGSGPTIGLGGINTVTLDTTTAPTIYGISFFNQCDFYGVCNQHWEIQGAGFGSQYNTSTIVKFWRNKVLTLGGSGATNYVFNDNVIYVGATPAGATTGKVMVITANGIAVTTDSWIFP